MGGDSVGDMIKISYEGRSVCRIKSDNALLIRVAAVATGLSIRKTMIIRILVNQKEIGHTIGLWTDEYTGIAHPMNG